jgi:hypothetical protein
MRPRRKPAGPPPFVPAGEPLGFARELKAKGRRPPPRRGKPDRKGPTATPFLVVPAVPGDGGARPIPGTSALHSAGLQILDGTGTAVARPVPGQPYTLRATVSNLGPAAAYAVLVDFYLGDPAAFDAAAAAPGTALPTQGRTGLMLLPGRTTTIDSPHQWTPANASDAARSAVVHAYDLIADHLTQPFDARSDRHVGRRDVIPDFAGVWDGTFTADSRPEHYLIRVVIAQHELTVDCSFFVQVGGHLPSSPQSVGSTTILGPQVALVTTDTIAGHPFTTNTWNLTLPDPDTLHLTNVHVFPPGDARPAQHWVADLHRI